MVRIYMMDMAAAVGCGEDGRTGEGLDEGWFGRCAGRLSPGRQGKIARVRQGRDKLLSLGAGLLLDLGLREYGLRERDVVMAYGSNGKPCLADRPDVHFNLSHSGTMVMAAFADRAVGCDVERMGPDGEGQSHIGRLIRVSERFFTPEERRFMDAGTGDEERAQRFYRLWTLKESYIKATGEGSRIPLTDFSVAFSERAVPSLLVKDGGGSWEKADYSLREFAVSGCRAAVCVAGELAGGSAGEDVFFSFQNLQDVV